MIDIILISILGLTATGVAAASCKTNQQSVNFDELPNDSVLPGPQIPRPYHGLYWQSFIVANEDIPGSKLPAFVPESPPNYAATISATSLLEGQPLLSTIYQNSTVQSFTPQDFYFGCSTNLGQGVVGIPTNCTLTITGYRGTTNDPSTSTQVCKHSYNFTANPLTAQTFEPIGPIKGCERIQFLTLNYTAIGAAAVANADVGLGLDNVRFTTCGN